MTAGRENGGLRCKSKNQRMESRQGRSVLTVEMEQSKQADFLGDFDVPSDCLPMDKMWKSKESGDG